jgi:glycosyltransferase involved in cell wall biosynthesis
MFKVSVIIITRNRIDELPHCLLSLMTQSLPPAEILIIDNGSTDHTQEVVASVRKKSRIPIRLISESKLGRFYARNRGIKEAKHGWIAFLDDDCVVDIDWIFSVAEFIALSPKRYQAVLAHTDTFYPRNVFALSANLIDGFWKENRIKKNDITDPEILDTKNVFFQKKFIADEALSFRKVLKNSDIDASEDCDFGMQFGVAGGKAGYKRNSVAFHKDPREFIVYWQKLLRYGLSHAEYERLWSKVRKREQRYYFRFLPFALKYCERHSLGEVMTTLVIMNCIMTILLRKLLQRVL